MKLYLISRDIGNSYDLYDSAVVAAYSEIHARTIHPSPFMTHITDGKWMGTDINGCEYEINTWVKYTEIDKISVECLGETSRDAGVILASFTAG